MTSALKLKPDKELAKLVGRHTICTEKARRRKKEQSLVRNITLSLPFMVWLHGSNVVHNPRGWGWVGRLVQGCGRTLTTTPIYSLDSQRFIYSLGCLIFWSEVIIWRYSYSSFNPVLLYGISSLAVFKHQNRIIFLSNAVISWPKSPQKISSKILF